MQLLAVEGLGLSFGGVRCLDDVTFGIAPGDVVGIIGPNGAGKTTLMNVLSGLLRPDRGRVVFGGQRIDRLPAHRIADLGIRRTFQTSRLLPGLTVFENILSGMDCAARYGIIDAIVQSPRLISEEQRMRARAEELAEFAGVPADIVDRGGQHLSFGQQRLVEYCRAIAVRPRLLMLDEPAVGLSPPRVAELSELIRRVSRETGSAVLLVEHVIQLVMSVCDRVIVLDAGSVIADGDPKEVTTNPRVIESYLGKRYYAAR